MSDTLTQNAIDRAQRGISQYLRDALECGRLDEGLFDEAQANVIPNLRNWMSAEPTGAAASMIGAARRGIAEAIERERWQDLVDMFRQQVRFGTGGVRGMMAFDRASIERLKREGINAPILKGPNTINNLVILRMSAGVAQFGCTRSPRFQKIVIGYDSRVRGADFGRAVAELFLAYGYTVYFFDAPCPYPEVTFAIPDIGADMGILISASHNDYRYNGYKLSCSNGSQFVADIRKDMYENYIVKATFDDIQMTSFAEADDGRLFFLGGNEPDPEFNYAGKVANLIDMHSRHAAHVRTFLTLGVDGIRELQRSSPLRIAYCAFHGAGRLAVPRLLKDVGFTDVRLITHHRLYELDGLFPAFESAPGRERQPDPGDPRAARIAVDAFHEEYGEDAEFDIVIGTDPDADRCGIVVEVPRAERALHDGSDAALLSADEAWALLLWFRFKTEIERYGTIRDREKKFIVLSHTTSDAITRLCLKHGIGVVRTWVGFASLAAATSMVWDGNVADMLPLRGGRLRPDDPKCHEFVCDAMAMAGRDGGINIAAMEQSNGFSILGGPPPDERSLGAGGHVRDKDGTLAALLLAELAAWCKSSGTSLRETLNRELWQDPEIGLFATFYEPDPLDGEYPGIEGDRLKKQILQRALDLMHEADRGGFRFGPVDVVRAEVFRTGKYDRLYPPSSEFVFPDEGVRLYFDDSGFSHATIRPSGTGNSLRFHVQLHQGACGDDVISDKTALNRTGAAVLDAIRNALGAPRAVEVSC